MKLFILLILILTPIMTSAQPGIKYEVSMPKPSNHLFEVTIRYENLSPDETFIDLILPVWRPGRYLIFDFASGVQEFNADNLKWKKINKNTWRIELNIERTFTARYKVYANEFNQRTRGLNDEHGFIDGTSVFMYSEKFRNLPVVLKVSPHNNWHVTTGLENDEDSVSTFYAPNYDYFVDCPLEIGNQKDIDFIFLNIKHTISIFGNPDYDNDTLINDFKKIIKTNLEFWGTLPYEKYAFIIHTGEQSSGGTEHINSCVLGVKPASFGRGDRNAYKNFLELVSHEFFHTWNVKQFRPKGIMPYDYSKENYIEELWLVEGGTEYYDGLMTLRAGLTDEDDFYKDIANSAGEERKRPGNRVQSLAESSFDAWVKFWKGNPQRYNSETDYYAKGADVCLILDLEIRHLSDNNHSLDDLFRTLWKRFSSSGYTNSDVQKICEEFTGTNFSGFFKDYVYGTKQLEWEKSLSYAGLELRATDSTSAAAMGLVTEQRGEKILVKETLTGSAADSSGITSGDEIVALNRERISFSDLNKKLETVQPGDSLTLTIFRNDKLKDFKLSLHGKKSPSYIIAKTPNPTPLQKSILKTWLLASPFERGRGE